MSKGLNTKKLAVTSVPAQVVTRKSEITGDYLQEQTDKGS